MFSNMNHFHSLNSMEGTFNPYFHGITPLASDKVPGYHHPQPTLTCLFNDEVPTQIGPSSLPNIDPGSHFFPSGHGCTGSNVMSEPEIRVNSFSSGSRTGYVVPSKVHKMHQVQNYCGKKRKRMGEGEMEKPREVVHVRAKRGQATDSHSLAERLRREKINEKLRCLQDLVPGCYKTMGMAVMLDVIINYVRSLQNQIDFLSMKMSAASLFYDFNSSEAEALETMRVNTGGYDAEQGMDRTDGEGYGTIPNYYQSPWTL